VQSLDLDVADKEFLVLLGPSGCGKTTTMRMIAGLETATSGDIFIGGQRVNDIPARDRDIAMVFQNYGLYPHLTVAENIAYPLRLRGIREPMRTERVQAAAAKVHLESVLERRPKALSGGQRQRVALARAIVRTPRLFLMDEPLSNLDAILRVSMRSELKHLHHELKTTTIYVTHDQIEAMTLATRVAVMNKGAIEQLGPPERIYEDPGTLFVARFIGSPPMNFLKGTLQDRVFRNETVAIDGFWRTAPTPVVLGVRPSNVRLGSPDSSDIKGRVFAVEYTGSDLQVTVAVGDSLVTAITSLAIRPTTDEIVGLTIDRAQAFLFDAATEQRIRATDERGASVTPLRPNRVEAV
jgi:multiple sugar transport system ATP-binding protein